MATRNRSLASVIKLLHVTGSGDYAAALQSARFLATHTVATRVNTPPARREEATDQLATAMSGSALVVTRDVEWGQVLLGFEQAQNYAVRDQDGNVVALLAEEHGGVGTMIGRQLLRSRRGFKATVLSPDGSEILFKMRRPPYVLCFFVRWLCCIFCISRCVLPCPRPNDLTIPDTHP